MKILLISSNTASTPYPTYPLGLSMVAAALKNAGYDVYQFDFLVNNCSLEKLGYKIKQIDPDIIGISIRNIDNVNLLNEQRYIDAARNIVKKNTAGNRCKGCYRRFRVLYYAGRDSAQTWR